MTFHPTGGSGSARVVPRRRLARLQHAAERARRRVHRALRPDAGGLRPHAGRSPCSTASRSTRTTPSRSTRRSSGTRSPRTCGGRSTGTSSPARAATPTATTRSGRCGPADARPINNPLMPWYEAIDQPGAGQMQYGRRLLESRPFLTRIPDDTVIVTDRVPTSVPGAGRYRFVATRDAEGRYAMVYAPVGRPFKVRMDGITGPRSQAWWFNPRDGKATPDRRVREPGRARVHAARPRRAPRLGARARRRGAGLPAARIGADVGFVDVAALDSPQRHPQLPGPDFRTLKLRPSRTFGSGPVKLEALAGVFDLNRRTWRP